MADALIRGAKIHYQRVGIEGATPVVFVHGLVMDNLASWYFTVAGSVGVNHDVLLYDLRGHGRSERTKAGYALDSMVSDLAELIDTVFGAQRAVSLVGNSFGGLVALAFARRFPSRTSKLVLVDAHLGDVGFGEAMARTLELDGEERDRQIAHSFKDWLGRHSERKRTRLEGSARALVEQTSLIPDMRTTSPLNAADLQQLSAPTLALYGEHSDLRTASEVLLRNVPSVTLRIVAGCTHSILWESTEFVRGEIAHFLRDGGRK